MAASRDERVVDSREPPTAPREDRSSDHEEGVAKSSDRHGDRKPTPAAPSHARSSGMPLNADGTISCRSQDVRIYEGLAPHGLSEAQLEQLLTSVNEAKRSSKAVDKTLFGWRIVYTLRGPGSASRGDMMVVDPRDEQKIFSMVGLKRKLGLDKVDGTWVQALDAPVKRKRQDEEEAAEEKKEEVSPKLEKRERRARTQVSYLDSHGMPPGRRIMEKTIAELDAAAEANSQEGLDLYAIVHGVSARLADGEPLPWALVRHSLSLLLRSGRVRRRLVSAPMLTDGGTESALRMLVLNALQVKPDDDAPWALRPAEPEEERALVSKGLTPPHLPHRRAAQLVGCRVQVWWEGDGAYHSAVVESFNEHDKQWGDDCPAGSHVLRYDNGLRVVESLEGDGEPQHWRLVAAPHDATVTQAGSVCDEGVHNSPRDAAAAEGEAAEGEAAAAEGEAAEGEAAEGEAAEGEAAEGEAAEGEAAEGEAAEAEAAEAEAAEAEAAEGEAAEGEAAEGEAAEAEAAEAEAAEAEAAEAEAAEAEAAEAEAAEGEAAQASEDTAWAAPKVENLVMPQAVLKQLPLTKKHPSTFRAPPGWSLFRSRKLPKQQGHVWALNFGGKDDPEFRTREELEEHLEREASKRGAVWLGQIVQGSWEIRPAAAMAALKQVVARLVSRRMARCCEARQPGGKTASLHYLVANRYFKGEPFPRPKNPVVREAFVEEELSEFELERKRNIEMNNELLRQLGLA
ncbi:hypothetical protein AB1Y20_021588 [Prymnesium parvum]|uniref:Uncharacterized protein n=1 Tax=Prymnesium parvum TaxID=97485 RepID=A0AB34JIP6_PRYPA